MRKKKTFCTCTSCILAAQHCVAIPSFPPPLSYIHPLLPLAVQLTEIVKTASMADEKVIKADAPSTVLAATSPSSKKKKSKTRTPLRRPRGKRGGIKNRKPSGKEGQREEEGTVKRAAQKAHALQIARFHTLEKKLAQTKDEEERARLLAEQTTLGGLQAYQDASLFGGDKSRGGETGKWCAGALAEERGKEKVGDLSLSQGVQRQS